MIKKLLELIQNALKKMLGHKSISQLTNTTANTISDKMANALDLWKSIYKDESPWLVEGNRFVRIYNNKHFLRWKHLLLNLEVMKRYKKINQ